MKLEDKYLVFGKRGIKRESVRFCLLCLDELAKYYRTNGVSVWWDNYMTMNGEIEKYLHIYGASDYEEALILFVFNILMQLDKSEIVLPKPIYGRGYPRLNNYNGYTYKHMRDMADKFFGK